MYKCVYTPNMYKCVYTPSKAFVQRRVVKVRANNEMRPSYTHNEMRPSYEARTRIAEKALRHAIDCDVACQHLDAYSNDPWFAKTISDCKQNAVVAWDIVEEVYAALSDLRFANRDPLDAYCLTHPDADECRMYDV